MGLPRGAAHFGIPIVQMMGCSPVRDGVHMTHRIFILGTSHELQCGAPSCGDRQISLFKEKIRSVLSEYGIARIAEEMSDEGFADSGGDQALGTLCQRVAGDVRVHFVDLTSDERHALGLSPGAVAGLAFSYAQTGCEAVKFRNVLTDLCGEVRERVWVARVLWGNEWPVLFVCGATHVPSVQGMLASLPGFEATIICADFDP